LKERNFIPVLEASKNDTALAPEAMPEFPGCQFGALKADAIIETALHSPGAYQNLTFPSLTTTLNEAAPKR